MEYKKFRRKLYLSPQAQIRDSCEMRPLKTLDSLPSMEQVSIWDQKNASPPDKIATPKAISVAKHSVVDYETSDISPGISYDTLFW